MIFPDVVSTSLLSTTAKQAGEAWIVLQCGMCVEMCLNDIDELLCLLQWSFAF